MHSAFLNMLVSEEIERMIAYAVKDGAILSAATCAASIVKTYSRCGLDESELANKVMMAADRAGVPVEIGGHGSVAAIGLNSPPKVVVPAKREPSRSAA
jgi:hypothetical protein